MTSLVRRDGARAFSIFICVAAIVVSAPFAMAADPVGEWTLTMDMSGRTVEGTLKIAKEADGSLSGTWTGRRGESELKDVSFADGTLSFLRPVNYQGQEFELAFEGKIDNDTLSGMFTTPMGDFEANGPRVVLASADGDAVADVAATTAAGGVEAIAGDWKWVSDSQLGVIESKLVVQLDGSAVLHNPGSDPVDVRDLTIDGKNLTFAVSINLEGEPLDLDFEGTISGDSIEGVYIIEDIGTVADIVGTRGGAGGLASMVGSWEVTSESQLGTTNHTIVITDEGGLTFSFEDREVTATDVVADGTKLTFNIVLEIEGGEIPLSFEGAIDGSNFEGEFLMEGASVAELSGSKAGTGIASLAGSWDITAEMPLGTLAHTMTLKSDGTGVYFSGGESSEVKGLTLDGSAVGFSITIHADGAEYEVDFEGKLEGSELLGNFYLEGSDVGTVTGKKQEAA